ncbi:MAG: hypothetical protein JNL65_06365 [Saprospiraceae bacterium]|nr:hypothetical protein [Saprospiraceae bacterium]HRG68458.1 hypothetical protein [Saprospiraceae bacterium]
MVLNKYIILISIYIISHFDGISQGIAAIQIEGPVKICKTQESSNKAKNLQYGPVYADQKIILTGKNARVKLVKNSGEICELVTPGTHYISSLSFTKPSENSFLGQLADYFVSFFESNQSSESKESYKNSIYAISRGELAAPVLDFPMKGILPSDFNSMEFSWSHSCDSCWYNLTIYELDTKVKVFSMLTLKKQFKIQQFLNYVKPGKKYYWKVEIPGTNLEFEAKRFEIAAKGDYYNQLKSIENKLKSQQLNLQLVPKTLFIQEELQQLELTNYAILYGKAQQINNPNNKQLKQLTEAFYYSQLKNNIGK